MPGPIGNKNAESAWFTPIDKNERTIYISGRILESQNNAVSKIIKQENITKSAIVREAIELWLKKKKINKGLKANSSTKN